MTELWQIFYALGDPSRLAMVKRLAASGPVSMVRLTEGMSFTRQAGAKHVFVALTKSGREQIVSLDRANFHLAEIFMRQMEAQWEDRLSALRTIVEDAG